MTVNTRTSSTNPKRLVIESSDQAESFKNLLAIIEGTRLVANRRCLISVVVCCGYKAYQNLRMSLGGKLVRGHWPVIISKRVLGGFSHGLVNRDLNGSEKLIISVGTQNRAGNVSVAGWTKKEVEIFSWLAELRYEHEVQRDVNFKFPIEYKRRPIRSWHLTMEKFKLWFNPHLSDQTWVFKQI